MSAFRPLLPSLVATGLVLALSLCVVLAGVLPLAMPMGLAAGGVLETGQVEPARWWLGGVVALAVYIVLTRRWPRAVRLWWLAILMVAMVAGVLAFAYTASSRQPRRVTDSLARVEASGPAEARMVGVVTALPLFWPEGQGVSEILAESAAERRPFVTRHPVRAIDYLDVASLRGLEAVLMAQPRLLRPEELVVFDQWVRNGGRAVIFADPLLVWPSELPPTDPRRPPLTSLLDPLLAHWGLRLAPARQRHVERRMLGTGHVVIAAGASHFTLVSGGDVSARCVLAEQGMMALCRIGRGEVRLIADADLLDERLWLAVPEHADRSESWAADVPALVDGWLDHPLRDPAGSPLRVTGEAALPLAMRAAIFVLLLCVGFGWGGAILWLRRSSSQNGKGGGNGGGTKFKGVQKMR